MITSISNIVRKLIVFIVLIGLFVQCDGNRTNWFKTFRATHKGPFGTYILNNEIKDFLQADSIVAIDNTVFNFFDAYYDREENKYTTSGTYIFVHENIYIDTESAEELLYFADHGNDIFIAAESFPPTLKDSLQFESISYYNHRDSLRSKMLLYNETFDKNEFTFSKGINRSFFSRLNPNKTTILGSHQIGDSLVPNFIKIPHGNGHFYLHTQPTLFTNYYLLDNKTYTYTENALSYLKSDTVFWDYDRNYGKEDDSSIFSPLRYLFQQKELTWAFWIAFLGIILFMIFNAKRRQRIIPIVKPLQNTTTDFAQTIGNLYFQEKNHKSIINKKITYFLEIIRTKYLLETDNLNSEFIERLHQKSGHKKGEIKLLINYINKLNGSVECSEGDLVRLNGLIEKFFKQ